jgi:hypothetical protein
MIYKEVKFFIGMDKLDMVNEKRNLVVRYPGQCDKPVPARWYHKGPRLKVQQEQTAQGTASSRQCRLGNAVYRKSG